jgi:hypothetical protein
MFTRSRWLLLLALGFLACTPKQQNPLAVDDDGDGYSEFDGDCDDADPIIGDIAPALDFTDRVDGTRTGTRGTGTAPQGAPPVA